MFPFSINKRRLFSCSGSNFSISNCSSTALNAFFHSSSFTLFVLINAIFNNQNSTTGRHWNEFLSNQNSCLNRSSVQPIKNRFTFLVTVTFGRTRYLTEIRRLCLRGNKRSARRLLRLYLSEFARVKES